jgi:hypothetical protein
VQVLPANQANEPVSLSLCLPVCSSPWLVFRDNSFRNSSLLDSNPKAIKRPEKGESYESSIDDRYPLGKSTAYGHCAEDFPSGKRSQIEPGFLEIQVKT